MYQLIVRVLGPIHVLVHGSGLWWFAFNLFRHCQAHERFQASAAAQPRLSLFWNFRRRRLTAFTHFSRQPIGFLFKGEALLLQIVHQLIPWCTALTLKLTVTQLIKKFHAYNSPSIDSILSQINPVHALPSYLFMLILSSHLPLRAATGPFATGFPTEILHAFRFFPCEPCRA